MAKRSDARYIWTDSAGGGRSRLALFRAAFDLPAGPPAGELSLFADTRYRLAVNGTILGHGPARFFVRWPEYDTFDLSPYLRAGRNVVAVAVHSFGRRTFHSDASIGGLIAWGTASAGGRAPVALASGPLWKALRCEGWREDSTRLSFALGPAEVLDARHLPEGWDGPDFDDSAWPAAVPLARQDHWGELRPRSIPLLDEREVQPAARLAAFRGAPLADEDVYAAAIVSTQDHGLTAAPAALLTALHSPADQDVEIACWWARCFINGRPAPPAPWDENRARQTFVVRLSKGWNSLLLVDQTSGDVWEPQIAWPRAAGLEVSARRRRDSAGLFLAGGPWGGMKVDEAVARLGACTKPADLPADLGPWRPLGRGDLIRGPYQERTWTALTPIEVPAGPAIDGAAVSARLEGGALVLLYDFGTEVLGRPVVEFTATAGTIVDAAYTERLRDGRALLGTQGTRMAERYVARDGRQTWRTMHPRGLRYLDLTVRGDLAAFSLHRVGLARANYPVRPVGAFACSDPVLDRIWRIGRDTEFACMEDAFVDCPWRERGLYTGDLLVQYYTNLACFGDHRLMRRCVELMFLTQGENGLLGACSHGLPVGRHPDYSAIAVQALWHYGARSGDATLARELEPRLRRLLQALEAIETPGLRLLDGTGRAPYIDLSHMDRDGINAAGNAFHQRAFADGARILRGLGDATAADAVDRQAAGRAEAIRRAFWDAARGVFVDRRREDAPAAEPSVPANALPLIYDIAAPEQRGAVLSWLAAAMAPNARVPEPRGNRDFNVTPYFSFYALEALYRHGLDVEAEAFIRDNWSRMLDAGAVVWSEYFIPQCSLCHAWSSAPTHYLSSRALGVSYADPADPDVLRIEPRPGTLRWAEGVYPHRRGPIHVAWERRGGKLLLSCELPDGARRV